MLLGRTKGDDDTTYFSKNPALGTGSSAEPQLSTVEKSISDFRLTGNALPARPVHPSATCGIGSTASADGTGMAGILAGAPRQAPALNPSLTSLKMVRRFCAITFTHAIFPIIGKYIPRKQIRARKMLTR